MINIAFFGPMCSGKTYLANHLVEHFGYHRVGFADKLKEVSADLFGINPKEKNDSTRKLLQGFSDDVKKWGGEDIWVKHLLGKLPAYKIMGNSVVLDDLRYSFEADALRKIDFKIVSIVVHENIRQERIASLYPDTSPEAQQHASEIEFKSIEPDYIVWSNKPDDVKDLEALLNGKRIKTSVRR